MNSLNRESKRSGKTFFACLLTAVISVVLTLSIVAALFFALPGSLNLVAANLLIAKYHIGEYDRQSLKNGALGGFVSGLNDRYSFYYDEAETEDRGHRLTGADSGLGIIVTKHPDREAIYIRRVYENSPAMKSGIKSGDIITAVDNKAVSEVGYSESVDAILRDVGESVTLTIERNGDLFEVVPTLEELTLQTVFTEKIGDYGYIEITSFNKATVDQFLTAINTLTESGVKGLIFDLRGNGGGTVSSVGEILDVLLPEGDVMTVKYKGGKTAVMLGSDAEELDLPMAVLTDGGTASAAELFTASIRDFEKGKLIGSKTFGKGVMQETFSLFGGSSIVLTVAEFLPHSLESFNGVGISPDIEVEQSEEELKYRYLLSLEEDSVVNKAIEWLESDTE